jgi:hypothetical protein
MSASLEKKLNAVFMTTALDLYNDASIPEDIKKLHWATLLNTMTNYARKNSSKITEEDLRGTLTTFLARATGETSEEIASSGLLDGALSFGIALQKEILRTKCWGVCKS